MPEPEDTRIRLLEEALRELRESRRVVPERLVLEGGMRATVTPAVLAGRFEAAEKSIQRIIDSGVLKEQDAGKFRDLATAAVNDQLREVMRGGAGELAATINVTVTGTGTISVS